MRIKDHVQSLSAQTQVGAPVKRNLIRYNPALAIVMLTTLYMLPLLLSSSALSSINREKSGRVAYPTNTVLSSLAVDSRGNENPVPKATVTKNADARYDRGKPNSYLETKYNHEPQSRKRVVLTMPTKSTVDKASSVKHENEHESRRLNHLGDRDDGVKYLRTYARFPLMNSPNSKNEVGCAHFESVMGYHNFMESSSATFPEWRATTTMDSDTQETISFAETSSSNLGSPLDLLSKAQTKTEIENLNKDRINESERRNVSVLSSNLSQIVLLTADCRRHYLRQGDAVLGFGKIVQADSHGISFEDGKHIAVESQARCLPAGDVLRGPFTSIEVMIRMTSMGA